LIFATTIFAFLPLSLSWQVSLHSLLPMVTTLKAEAWTYRRARVTYRRAYRRAYRWGVPNYAHGPDGYGYPYQSGYSAYSGVYAPPGRGWGWGWGHHWGHGFGWGWHRGWRW
jgi:hypothetical protein